MKVTGTLGSISLILLTALLVGWLILGVSFRPVQSIPVHETSYPQPISSMVRQTTDSQTDQENVSQAGSHQAPLFHSCVYNQSYRAGKYLVLNNQWNRRLMGPNDVYEQCIQVNSSANPLNVEWYWTWPKLQRQVKAFPEIIYGWAPWLEGTTDPHLPMPLSKIAKTTRFEVRFDTSVSAAPAAIYNTAFDLFITSTPIPIPETRTHEIMIWMNDQHAWISTQSQTYVNRLTIGGERYDFWHSPGQQTILIFRRVHPAAKGTIVINDFLDYLLNDGYIPGDGYLADIEFGNEIIYGSGRTYIHDYSITAVSTTRFADVPSHHWAWEWIERLYNAELTSGCSVSPLNFCPENSVTRAEMAVFLLKGIHGPEYTPPGTGTSTGFSDVPVNHWAAPWIEQLAAEGITGGCGSVKFCPDKIVPRDQMAVFLLRSKYGAGFAPLAASGMFSDVPMNYWSAAWIEQLAREGITAGCAPNMYCPASSITRAQMAVFLVRTFNLP